MSNIDLYSGGILGLLSSAGPVAKVVVFILVLFSIVSWTIMLLKWKQFSKTEKEGERFIRAIKDADSFKKVITAYRENPDNAFYRLIATSYKEIASRHKENPGPQADMLPFVENTLRIVISEETEKLERRLSFLATTGNTAPFIGLFGTVWGIMTAFLSLGTGSADIGAVGPGIFEVALLFCLDIPTFQRSE